VKKSPESGAEYEFPGKGNRGDKILSLRFTVLKISLRKRELVAMRMLQIGFLLLLAMGCRGEWTPSQSEGAGIRNAAVAGKFYPAEPQKLKLAIQKFLQDAVPPRGETTLGLVLPHAGYVYSGQIAADGYRQAAAGQFELVVILGTNHTVPGFKRIALPPFQAFQTPLGSAPVDQAILQKLTKENPDCIMDSRPHLQEHSIEVQIPFVQTLFPRAQILPVVVGLPDVSLCTRFGQSLASLLRNRKALIVASSDLSHYPESAVAVKADRQTLEAMARLDPAHFSRSLAAILDQGSQRVDTAACGEAPIMVLLSAMAALGGNHIRAISYANSGDLPIGDLSRVVGYGALAFLQGSGENDFSGLNRPVPPGRHEPLQAHDRKQLLALARETILRWLTTDTVPLARGFLPRLHQGEGAFVTLKKNGQLRGCIGNLVSEGPLCRLVGTLALQAALNDRRFAPVQLEEMDRIQIEVSVLSPMKTVANPSEIVLGRDGVVLTKGKNSAVFLPQVALEQGWNREELLDQLARKAGLAPGSWKQGAKFEVFQTEVFHE
jgi:AmmeMemoRadiSam system protein B/AmmeMemoRadiSam system protein A